MLRLTVCSALLLVIICGCGSSSSEPVPQESGSVTIQAGAPSKAFQAAFDRAQADREDSNRGEAVISMPVLDTYEPLVAGPAGRRAFDDLAKYYRHGEQPPFDEALQDLKSQDAQRRVAAGNYIHAIFVQSLADKTNGRGNLRQEPFWGGGTKSDATELRKSFAERFGRSADASEALDAALWLIEQDPKTKNQSHGAAALCHIDVEQSEAIFRDLLARPHPNRDVLLALIDEVAKRQYKGLAGEVTRLATHYRDALRIAARRTAATLEIKNLPAYQAEHAFTPWLDQQLKNVVAMINVDVPDQATWVTLTVTTPPYRDGGKPFVTEHHGWHLETSNTEYRVLTQFGDVLNLDKKQTSLQPSTLAAQAKSLLEVRKGSGRDAMERLSRRGGLTGQFEAGFISLPEGLVAAWLYAREDKATAATLLFPRIEAADDDRWVFEVMKELIADRYHQQMLVEFSRHRNYDRTTQLARHLSQSIFDGYRYQRRAKQLLEQLARRQDDFKVFRQPRPDEWSELKEKLSRIEQIEYLAGRLRLLNCEQMSQPGGVSYQSPQFATPSLQLGPDGAQPTEVINPYNELLEMRIRVAELPALEPFLGDDHFMPTFSYWRDFHPSRTLHQANWVVAKVINASAKRELAQIEVYDRLDEDGRHDYLDKVIQWCRENGDKSREELLVEVLNESSDFPEFERAASECVKLRIAEAAAKVADRFDDFPRRGGDIAELSYRFNTAEVVSHARSWIVTDNEGVQFWSALILLRHGDRQQLEGLSVLQRVLAEDDGSYWYPRAIEPLLECGQEEALKLACGITAKDRFTVDDYHAGEILQRLFLAGRRECFDFLLGQLDSPAESDATTIRLDDKGAPQTTFERDEAADMLAEWHPQIDFDLGGSDAERAAARKTLKQWLKDEFSKIQAGEQPTIDILSGRMRFSEWQIDAP